MRKIGELKGKPIIEGNPNEIKKNQIHYKESDGGITLSERKEDNTLSSVTSGSGSGEGVKEYYYKLLVPQETWASMISSTLSSAFFKFLVKNKRGVVETTHVLSIENYADNNAYILPYIKMYDIPFQYVSVADDNLYSGNIYNVGTGDMFDRMAKMMNMNVSDVKEQLKGTVQEITKEEYEAMITYKPE